MEEQTGFDKGDRRLSVGNFLATIALAGGLVTWSMSMNERLTRVEEQVASALRVQGTITERQNRTDARIEATMSDIRRELVRINDKLDEKADRNGRKQ